VAVEKMVMLNMIGSLSILDDLCQKIILIGDMHPINAFEEINITDFTIEASEKNKEALVEVGYIKPYLNVKDYTSINKKIEKIKNMSKIKDFYKVMNSELICEYSELQAEVERYYSKFEDVFEGLLEKEQEEEIVSNAIKHLSYIKNIDLNLKEIGSLTNFKFELLKVSKENIEKLKHNYENIPSIIMSVFKSVDFHIIMCFTPELLKLEAERIFKSLNCEVVDVPMDTEGAPKEIICMLELKLKGLKNDIAQLDNKLKTASEENKKIVSILSESLELQKLSEDLKSFTAYSDDFFYMCGWVSKSNIEKFKNIIEEFKDNMVIIEKCPKDIRNLVPPTNMKNNILVKPFETMVNMYGMPSYDELDPTFFLGISYMITFGAMFGDVGQGLVIFFAGLFLKHYKNMVSAGGVLSRLGISSTIFGFLYGSVFGFEEFIEPIFIRPMDNISEILIFAIIFGCILLLFGFGYSLINSIKRKDFKNGMFGKDGISGVLFYASIICFALSFYLDKNIFSASVWTVIFAVLLLTMLFKEPLANLIQNKRPLYTVNKGDYFVEEGFGIVETILSMFSNTLSFIRVGAFALNHVGLFLAFSALAKMMNSSFGSLFIYIIGNVLILGLEGLIVFIQGLRLQYYELFSKYYEGAGIQFRPIGMVNKTLNTEKINNNKLIKKFFKAVEE
jgi:V/A-type H+-transporting ATPase subunit I